MAGIGNQTEESANFYRLVTLIVDFGSEILQDVLLHLLKPSRLEAVLQANTITIDNLVRTKVIFRKQYDLLTNITPNVEEFDISLLVVIFRNICPNVPAPILGWNVKEPDVNDFSLAADLLRLRNIRNEVYAHRSSTNVTKVVFETLWLELTAIIERISRHGSGKYQDIRRAILVLKQQALDPKNDKKMPMLDILENWQKQDEDLNSSIEDFKTSIVQRLDKQVHLQKV